MQHLVGTGAAERLSSWASRMSGFDMFSFWVLNLASTKRGLRCTSNHFSWISPTVSHFGKNHANFCPDLVAQYHLKDHGWLVHYMTVPYIYLLLSWEWSFGSLSVSINSIQKLPPLRVHCSEFWDLLTTFCTSIHLLIRVLITNSVVKSSFLRPLRGNRLHNHFSKNWLFLTSNLRLRYFMMLSTIKTSFIIALYGEKPASALLRLAIDETWVFEDPSKVLGNSQVFNTFGYRCICNKPNLLLICESASIKASSALHFSFPGFPIEKLLILYGK